MPKLSVEEYLKRDGLACPACKSRCLDAIDFVQVDGAHAWQRVMCLTCSATWNDVFRLEGYSELEEV